MLSHPATYTRTHTGTFFWCFLFSISPLKHVATQPTGKQHRHRTKVTSPSSLVYSRGKTSGKMMKGCVCVLHKHTTRLPYSAGKEKINHPSSSPPPDTQRCTRFMIPANKSKPYSYAPGVLPWDAASPPPPSLLFPFPPSLARFPTL